MISTRRFAFSEPDSASSHQQVESSYFPCRIEDNSKLCVVLDLDETLVHCEEFSFCPLTQPKNSYFLPFPDGTGGVQVAPRPFLKEFLFSAAERYELVVFTAGLEEYANLVLDSLDPTRTLFRHRLTRKHCTMAVTPGNGSCRYLKDLAVLKRNMSRMVMVDNVIHNVIQIENGIPIVSFYSNPLDYALISLHQMLFRLDASHDVRQELYGFFKLGPNRSLSFEIGKEDSNGSENPLSKT
jgi:CTD small phosphatase-like protein 2